MKKITILALSALTLIAASCSFFNSIEEAQNPDWEGQVKAISLGADTITLGRLPNGDEHFTDIVTLSITPADLVPRVTPRWTVEITDGPKDSFRIDGNASGCTVTGKKKGQGYIKCELNNIVATCLVKVEENAPGMEEHYIYSKDEGVVQLCPSTNRNISVTLFNGTSEDYENFEWSVADPSVAEISSARNNCVVDAKKLGSTQITVKHPRAEYDYTFVVFVYPDLSRGVPYISTRSNIVAINTNSNATAKVEFTVENDASNGASETQYSYEDTTSAAYGGPGSVVSITTANSKTLQITGLRKGQAEITVRNRQCEYPLKITVIVSTIVENVYVTTSESTLQISDDYTHTIYAYLNGYDGVCDTSKFTWSIEPIESAIKNYTETYDSRGNKTGYTAYMDFIPSGDMCQITGKKNGVFRVSVGHERAAGARNLIVMLTNQKGSAKDASMFITTSQNYVQTQVGAGEIPITVTMVGGVPGDESGFKWEVRSGDVEPGVSPKTLVDCWTSHGTVVPVSRSALTSGTDVSGTLYIKANGEGKTGTARITVGHDKCMYTTDIIVKVYSEWALLEDPVYMDVTDADGHSVSLVKALYTGTPSDETIQANINGSPMRLNAFLYSTDKESNKIGGAADETASKWKAEGQSASSPALVSITETSGASTFVSGAGITDPDTGKPAAGMSYVTASHAKAQSPKRVLFLTADTEEELNSLKGVYAEQTYFRLSEDPAADEHKMTLNLKQFGLSPGDEEHIKFVSDNGSVASAVNTSANINHITAEITGNGAGRTKIRAWYEKGAESCPAVEFDIVVVAKGESVGVIEAKYLTTPLNAVVIPEKGTADVSVVGKGLSPEEMLITEWNFKAGAADDVVSIASNSGNATLTALKTGKTALTVSNDNSVNSVDIQVKVGDIYEYEEGFFPYITSPEDTYLMVAGENKTIGASLVNVNSPAGGWKWEAYAMDGITKSPIVELTPVASPGRDAACQVKALEAGQAYIRVSHPQSVAEKEVLLVIGNTVSELNGFAYLSTKQNVVTVGELSNVSVQVSVENAASKIVSGFEWSSSDPSVVSVVGSGATAVFYGNKTGTAVVTVKNDINGILYPLEIIANCVDPVAAAQSPYIDCDNIVTVEAGGGPYELSAQLVGGRESDNVAFEWYISGAAGIIRINSANNVCQIEGLEAGISQIRIRHPRALSAERTVLVIVNEKSLVDYEIETGDSSIQSLAADSKGGTTLTVSLKNGSQSDNTAFTWWASNYDIADLKAVENRCVVTPKKPGSMELYVSHPKAKNPRTFQITVSKTTNFDFAYPSDIIPMTAGRAEIISMNVPTLNAESQYVTYETGDSSVADIGLSSSTFCQLNAKAPGTTVVIARLWGYKNGKAEEYGEAASRYVRVTEAPATNKYIKLTSGTALNTIRFDKMDYNKTESLTLSATVTSDDADTRESLKSAGLDAKIAWSAAKVDGTSADFTCAPSDGKGSKITLTPLGSGVATLTASVPGRSDITPKTVYIVVNGTDQPAIELPSLVTLGENGDSEVVKATITGGDANLYKRLEWGLYENRDLTIKHTDESIAKLSGTGASVNITGVSRGEVYLVASISALDQSGTEIAVQKVCTVKVEQSAEIRFDQSTVMLQPGTAYDMGYSIYPPDDTLMDTFLISVRSVLEVDWQLDADGSVTGKRGSYYSAAKRTDSRGNPVLGKDGKPMGATWYDPDTGRGNLRLIAKAPADGQTVSTLVTAETKKRKTAGSFQAVVGYNYMFTWDKSFVTTVPEKTAKKVAVNGTAAQRAQNPLRFTFSVRPATCEIWISWKASESDSGSKYLKIDGADGHHSGCTVETHEGESWNGTGWQPDARGSEMRWAVIRPDGTQSDPETGIATGTVAFYTDGGQVNTAGIIAGGAGGSKSQSVKYRVVNPADSETGTSANILGGDGERELVIKSYYPSLTLGMADTRNIQGVHSRWESKINSLVIGDGEIFQWKWTCDKSEYIGSPEVHEVTFEKFTGEIGMQNSVNMDKKPDYQRDRIRVDGSYKDSGLWRLVHRFDYGWNNIITCGCSSCYENSVADIASGVVKESIAGLKPSENTAAQAAILGADSIVVYFSQAGTLKAKYFDYASGNMKDYCVKVYAEVRNSRRDAAD